MKEELVSYEQARKLEELSFNYDCCGYYYKYDPTKVAVLSTPLNHNNRNLFKDICSAPRLDEAQKWLREVKGINVRVNYFQDYKEWFFDWLNLETGEHDETDATFDSYESALSAGIDAVLNLLSEKQ